MIKWKRDENYRPPLEIPELDEKKMSMMEAGYIGAMKTLADNYQFIFIRQLFYGILSGIWIGLAYTCAILVAENQPNASMTKFVLGTIFSLVILLIFALGGQFFTAYTYGISGVIRGLAPWKEALKSMGVVYIGNFLGCLLYSIIFELAHGIDQTYGDFVFNTLLKPKLYTTWGDVSSAIKSKKNVFGNVGGKNISLAVMYTFFSAILCNILVSSTIAGNRSAKGNIVASMIMMFVIICIFCTSGYQHCVANWHPGTIIIVMGWFHNKVTIDGQLVDVGLSVGWFFGLVNILPALFGNLVGAILLGEILYICNRKNAKILFAKYKAYWKGWENEKEAQFKNAKQEQNKNTEALKTEKIGE